MKDFAISVRGLGKRFRRSSGARLDLLRHTRDRGDWFWALKDLTFDVERGTGLGIIGGNGAGKSTRLKILARIVAPTEGEAEIGGRVNSLLEVGTGFQADLSGRANIYLNASILGMSKTETDEVFEDIVDFSGIREFIDMPVKYYSSGMYSRLAFSVAANVTGDILLIDEVLSVGDAEFRKKCMGRMNSLLTSEHRTVLYVSHSMDAVLRFCSHTLWLNHGRVEAFGNSEDVVSDYLRSVNQLGRKYVSPREAASSSSVEEPDATESEAVSNPQGSHDRKGIWDSDTQNKIAVVSSEAAAGFEPAAFISAVAVADMNGDERDILAREEPITIVIDCEVTSTTYEIHPVIHLHCGPRPGVHEETHVFSNVGEPPLPRIAGYYRIEAMLPDHLLTLGQYSVSVALVTSAKPIIRHCKLDRVLRFQVIERGGHDDTFLKEKLHGVVHPRVDWHIRIADPDEAYA